MEPLFNPKWEGLGVAQVDDMATSFINPKYILCGLYHDGTQLSDGEYESGWNPDWETVIWGDGQQPLIDNINDSNMYASAQGGYWTRTEDYFDSLKSMTNSTCYWGTQGVLNKENTETLFRNKITGGKEDVLRSTAKGDNSGSHEIISQFSPLFPNFNEIIIIGLYTPYDDGDVLIASLLVRNTGINDGECHLFRTNNANDQTSQVIWNELSIPRDDWIASVEFDPDNNDILHICYSRSSNENNWPLANNFYQIDYTNLSSPTVIDMTKNLPYTAVGENSIEIINFLEKGIYLASEFGVFYTNNTL